MARLRLPIVQDTGDEDPLALLRGGRFARLFAALLAVIGLFWIVSARVEARDTEHAVVLVPTFPRPAGVVAGDLDGDAAPDLVTADPGANGGIAVVLSDP